jgi:uncharacterized protein (UPF0264 family)
MMIPRRGARALPQFLASVTSVAEAGAALAGGADVIDAKNPSEGALGALPLETVGAIRAALPRHVTLSATIGDLAPEPGPVTDAARAMAATGVDIVKVGFFPGGDVRATIRALGAAFGAAPRLGARGRSAHGPAGTGAPVALAPSREAPDREAGGPRLVGLLLADRAPDFSLISEMAAAGFAGVMLDTAGKASGALPSVMPQFRLAAFVREAHRCGLFAGLAGSLAVKHIPQLAALGADILGFRGALCRGAERTGALDLRAVEAVARALEALDGHHAGGRRAERVSPA